MLLHGQVVESLLDKQTTNAVRMKDEIGSVCVLVADNAVARRRWSMRAQCTDRFKRTYVRREISWGVCGRMCTFSWGISVETVAVGLSDLYSGPTHLLGARPSSLVVVWVVLAMVAGVEVCCEEASCVRCYRVESVASS